MSTDMDLDEQSSALSLDHNIDTVSAKKLRMSKTKRTLDDNGDPVRKRTLRACDKCNHFRTKCDGKQPCARCIDLHLKCEYLRIQHKRGKASQNYIESAEKKAAAMAAATGSSSSSSSSNLPHSSSLPIVEARSSSDSSPSSATMLMSTSSQGLSHESLSNKPGATGVGLSSNNTNYASLESDSLSSSSTLFTSNSRHPVSFVSKSASVTDRTISESHSTQHAGSPDFLDASSFIFEKNSTPAVSNSSANHNGDTSNSVHTNLNTASASNPTGGVDSNQNDLSNVQRKLSFSLDSPSLFQEQSPSSNWLSGLSVTPQLVSQLSTENHHPTADFNVSPNGQPGSGTNEKFETFPGLDRPPGYLSQHPHNPAMPLSRHLSINSDSFSLPGLGPQHRNSASNTDYFKNNGNGSSSISKQLPAIGLNDLPQDPQSAVGVPARDSRYPILDIIEPLIAPFPMSLARDLLETYFSHSTHVLAYLIRRSSILASENPRKTSPALLFSFLLVAAHHSDNPVLTGAPATRQNVIDRFMDLTISHLTPLQSVSSNATLDDIITYIQLGTVISASEFKGSSLRWWASAWALAKELKLNQEVPSLDEESREEQRRTWWLLYMVDRHLGLCYNRPLAILDSESMDLYRPIDEDLWNSDIELTPPELDPNRIRGICHYVTGQGIYGYFLPLMSILGSLIELHHLEQNPIVPFGDMCNHMRSVIRGYLDQFTASLKNWSSVPCQYSYENAWKDYAFQLIHVFQILVAISWDPLELMRSPDSMIMTHEFNETLNHAISAAKHIRRILTVDHDLMLMPFFFGIYLLQGSFVLVFIVDRVESEASQDVFVACETIVHAHEVCIVTLNTEYQRNFRRVMRGTMSLLSPDGGQKTTPNSISSLSPTNPLGGGVDAKTIEEQVKYEKEEARRRRKDVLGLYRWTSGGHGLAV